ncbi:hypothetical protein ONS95_002947 [Cadophora gregata]|uniref:uncharacterized protein n=1 Tax=Cadophora gregata TaxID=51156 RepID=UPI0026DD8FA6|nr:uncharacterized protein ONS95_002947 [Cadophora gregata]KAK0108124.1 hypothetical protein ONS95_002947 [Cadophora gregata]KAK0109284.1 hypothetical protein ONS96_003104 [Cadophora gregata f. sp. sojae]
MYAEYGEFRDINFEHLRALLNEYLIEKLNYTDVELISTHTARKEQYDALNKHSLVGLGPAGVARMLYSLTESIRSDCQSNYTKEELAEDEAVKREATTAEEHRKRQTRGNGRRESDAEILFADSGIALDSDDLDISMLDIALPAKGDDEEEHAGK